MSVLAIDQGTSATKAVVVDDSGTVLATAVVEIRPQYLAHGAVEQDPAELHASVLSAGRQAVAEAGTAVSAVSLANQGETVMAWDRSSGRALSTAISWQDKRAESVCDRLRPHADEIAQRTGLVLSAYFSAPKMKWLRENLTHKGVVTTTDSWLVAQLTGEFVTDVTTASRSLLLDLDALVWSPELIDLFGLSAEPLPRIVGCDEIVGTTSAFGPELPVAGLVVDQQAALLAEGCIEPGSSKCTYGTGAFILANTGSHAPRSASGLTTSVALRTSAGTQYCLDGQVYTAAAAIRWLQDVGLIADVRDLDRETATDSEGAMFIPALAGLAAPYWRDDARGSLSGLSLVTGRSQIVRATIEGIAAQIALLAAVVSKDLGSPLTSLRADGGLTRSKVLMQVQADLLQLPVQVYPSADATALGTAALARMATQPDLTLVDAVWPWTPAAVYEPQWSVDRAETFLARWSSALERDLPVAGR